MRFQEKKNEQIPIQDKLVLYRMVIIDQALYVK